jgi:hypothetical protein
VPEERLSSLIPKLNLDGSHFELSTSAPAWDILGKEMVLTTQRIKDHCLIIVGDGGEADQILARRRMAAGGRFAHFLTKGPNDSRVRQQHVMNGATQDAEYFTWQPPSSKMPLSSFAKKFSGRSRSFWTKLGPDGVELEASQQLTITSGVDGNPRHLELWDEDGNLLVQMSGEITVDIDKQAARTMDVEAGVSILWRFAKVYHFVFCRFEGSGIQKSPRLRILFDSWDCSLSMC